MSENCGVHDGVGNWGSLRNVEANAGEHLRPSVIGRRMKADCILGGLGNGQGLLNVLVPRLSSGLV